MPVGDSECPRRGPSSLSFGNGQCSFPGAAATDGLGAARLVARCRWLGRGLCQGDQGAARTRCGFALGCRSTPTGQNGRRFRLHLDPETRGRFVRVCLQDAAGTVILNSAAVVLGLVLPLVLARPRGCCRLRGVLFCVRVGNTAVCSRVLGLTPVLIRTARLRRTGEVGRAQGFWSVPYQVVLVMSLSLAGVAMVLGLMLLSPGEPAPATVFHWAGAQADPRVSMVRMSTLQGLGHVLLGRLPETIVAPANLPGARSRR